MISQGEGGGEGEPPCRSLLSDGATWLDPVNVVTGSWSRLLVCWFVAQRSCKSTHWLLCSGRLNPCISGHCLLDAAFQLSHNFLFQHLPLGIWISHRPYHLDLFVQSSFSLWLDSVIVFIFRRHLRLKRRKSLCLRFGSLPLSLYSLLEGRVHPVDFATSQLLLF